MPDTQIQTNATYVSILRAADFYGVSRWTITRWVARGYLPHKRFGRTIRIRLDDGNGDGPEPKPVVDRQPVDRQPRRQRQKRARVRRRRKS